MRLEPRLEHHRGGDLVDELLTRAAVDARFVERALGRDGGEPLVVRDDLEAGAALRSSPISCSAARAAGPIAPDSDRGSPTTIVVTSLARAMSRIAR